MKGGKTYNKTASEFFLFYTFKKSFAALKKQGAQKKNKTKICFNRFFWSPPKWANWVLTWSH